MKKLFALIIALAAPVLAAGQSREPGAKTKMEPGQNITVLELRNYLLRPQTVPAFRSLFNTRFVGPMHDLGGNTLGQFRLVGEPDHFVWMRGYRDMKMRSKFLNDFYLNSPVWKAHRADANSMIVNSDNVYLLKPLSSNGNGISPSLVENDNAVVVVDLYVCNSTLDKVIELFENEYLGFLARSNVSDVSMWVSEMMENDFPRLPAFQDKNLLVTMTGYRTEREYRRRSEQIKAVPAKLDLAMHELITTRSRLVLLRYASAK